MFYTKSTWIFVTFILIYLEIQNIFSVSAQYGGARDRIRSNFSRVPVIRKDQLLSPDIDIIDSYEEIHPLTDLSTRWHRGGYTPVKLHPCEQSSCYPATGNLLIGREKQLFASSTCGLHEKQRYCIVSHLEDPIKCFWCDSRPFAPLKRLLNHSISHIVYDYHLGTRDKSWWQSENGKENVYIQLNLEAEFHFTHLIIKFKTFRPAAMLIERSYDFGKTWQIYRYFAYNCQENFPGVPVNIENLKNLTDIICVTRYSQVAPSSDGELIYRVLPPTKHIDNPYSQEVQNLLKMTNLRINFTKLHTLGDDLLDKREDIQEKYYYGINDMVVRGSCSCYGHANRCLPLPGMEAKPDMVHGRCECTHNTKGSNCEECEDFYNDLPWRPAIGKQTNACKKCNCNNHALSCHFDAAVYEQTGRISGGVCDGCKHNTMGSNCEQCKPFYFKDPSRDIQDPELCRSCDCDPHGALDGGICDSITDVGNALEAGKCHCKTNVDGRRCDTCKNGFWNFDVNNPDGCQACTCSTLGTIDNQGCNMYNGECTCKRYVTGRDCNQCLPEYWGLSDKKDGCQLCQCDPGGSYDNNCDVVGGQCKCRDHMTGRRCDIPEQQYFTPSLDFLLYEAEVAKASSNCQVVIREPYRNGRENTWTGTGFVRAYQGSSVEFTIDDIKASMDYDLVIRYESEMPNPWQDVTITIERLGPIDPNGPCRNTVPSDDVKKVSLPSDIKSVTVYPPTCLEAGQVYKVRLDFISYDYRENSPSASVLIDSIVLIPKIDEIPWFNGTDAPAEFNKHHCSLAAYIANKDSVDEVCQKYFISIGSYIFQGALACHCDPTGSVSKLCAEYGGNCLCKPNVVGRRCERCAPGTFDFGPGGCQACDCNSIGASDNFCNMTTGQCKCRPNTYGRECDQCRTGFWNFPNCQRCDCHGHADVCDSRTGACISCRDNTQGHYCDQCIEGYYGDPRLGVDIPCRPCPCPGVNGSGHNFAHRCSLDLYSKDVVCECKEGYSGTRCNICDNNYYGNPESPGGSCQKCECSDKIDLQSLGNCDPHSGKCLKCLYDTTGDHCEICRSGYFRYDDAQICQECVCHILGSNATSGPCDPYNGQCPCFPNVIGTECDQCAENYWKIASGSGCVECNCDPLGSERQQCNLYDGQCDCKENFGGRQCNECRTNSWGNPKNNECYSCDCDIYGSETTQCDRKTGACVCRPGIGGHKCNQCARGYLGIAPVCTPCGECFDNWDRILDGHKNTTIDIIERAKSIKKIGATGAYTKEFDEIQAQLDEIENLLNSTKQIDVQSIEEKLTFIRDQINITENGPLLKLNNLLDNATRGIVLSNISLQHLKQGEKKLRDKIAELEQNSTTLQEGDVKGALNLIENAKQKADIAAHKAEHTQEVVNYAERQCKATENLINMTEKEFNEMRENNEKALDEIKSNLTNLNSLIPDLNELICHGRGDPCDSVCGGAGCGSCGNAISCENGAKQQAESALNLANKTEMVLREKEAKANDFIRSVNQLDITETKQQAEKAFETAYETFLSINVSLENVNNMKKRINDFLNLNHSTPEEIKKVAQQVLEKHIDLKPEEIVELAKKIKETVESLTNIDPIIQATAGDLKQVQKLKEDADKAKTQANQILKVAEEVKEALANSSLAQEQAGVAISTSKDDIDKVNLLLDQIGVTVDDAHKKTNKTSKQINNLANKIEQLKRNITSNEVSAQRVIEESQEIQKEANKTYEKSETLLNQYQDVKLQLEGKLANVENTKLRSDDLLKRAFQLISQIKDTESAIEELKSTPEFLLQNLEKDIQRLIDEMEEHNKKIAYKESYYKKCT